jgi:hypothetical protein
MTQTDIPAWCETLQAKLMAALDAVWAILDSSDDPAEIRKARDKAKACGELAAVARKVVAMAGLARPKGAAQTAPGVTAPTLPLPTQAEHALRALEKLKASRRR